MMIVRDLPVLDMAPGPERQRIAAAGAPKAAEDAPVADEGALAVPAPVQAPQPPPPAVRPARTMAQRLARMMSQAGVRYTSYADFQIPYVRRTAGLTVPAPPQPSTMSSSQTHDPSTPCLTSLQKKSTMLVKYLQSRNLEVLES
ncbi:hypothetical protein Tco_1527890 [Tanacetum coccineum]